MNKGVTTRAKQDGDDRVAVEEPLEIRVSGETLAITMRTPGDDDRLALGFLLSEGIIKSAADVGTVAYCGKLGEEGRDHRLVYEEDDAWRGFRPGSESLG